MNPSDRRAPRCLRPTSGDLIRLRRGTSAAEREAIALGLETFAGILGRDGDILIAPDGTRLTRIDHFQRGVDRVARIQVIQESADHVRVLVVPRPGYRDGDRESPLRNIRAKLPPFVIRRPAPVGSAPAPGAAPGGVASA